MQFTDISVKFPEKSVKYGYIGEISPIIAKKKSEISVDRLSKGYFVWCRYPPTHEILADISEHFTMGRSDSVCKEEGQDPSTVQ